MKRNKYLLIVSAAQRIQLFIYVYIDIYRERESRDKTADERFSHFFRLLLLFQK
jgi:hypothetical protein